MALPPNYAMTDKLNRTALYSTHVSMGGQMVPFGGWEMPLQFQSILAEARAVRSSSGIFDVSHMGRIWLRGHDSAALMDWVTTANIPALVAGRARYTIICTDSGGILDDGLVYCLGHGEYLLVCNAGNRKAVWNWLLHWRDIKFPAIDLNDRTLDVGMIAFQGPEAHAVMERLSPKLVSALRPFECQNTKLAGIHALISRTGYTGEDGFEIMPCAQESPVIWQHLLEAGAKPCGLGSRDVLRLESGLMLHGADMDHQTNPFQAGLERFVFMEKESVYSNTLADVLEQGIQTKLVGFYMLGRGVPRHSYSILQGGTVVGQVTSGGYSPTLDRYIGLGYVSLEQTDFDSNLEVDIRGKLVEAKATALPFYSRRRG
ncbi:glycine cleavage system aminomethyltransferase GcvT [Dehalococcoidia bacterium]|nr:glycine cleavage system aminomethyltransferase GcvT [Dehalococcoidia bacterium]